MKKGDKDEACIPPMGHGSFTNMLEWGERTKKEMEDRDPNVGVLAN